MSNARPSLKLIQLNIEGHRHIERILPFFEKEQPDVVCLQELQERDIPTLKEVVGPYALFTPMLRRPHDDHFLYEGTGIISRFPLINNGIHHYAGTSTITTNFDSRTTDSKRITERFMLVHADVEKDDTRFRVATTHFTWTPDGEADDYQRGDLKALFSALDPFGECILTGDFNAPRGREIFTLLAEKYTDNVPAHYTSSIDGTLHRAGPLELMVDGIFSTPSYAVTDVSMHGGVSDHCALVATISKS